MEDSNKLHVGQKLWMVISRPHHKNVEPVEVVISKVGKKYFELEDYHRDKFDIETLRSVNETNYKNQCYFTLQEILDNREFNRISEQLKNIFVGYNEPKLTLEQLRKIKDVIEGEKTKDGWQGMKKFN